MSLRTVGISFVTGAAVATAAVMGYVSVSPEPDPAFTLATAHDILHNHSFVDLTHAFRPGIPHWKGFPDEARETVYTIENGGFFTERFTHVGQWGTHADPPVHFHAGLRSLDQIDPQEFILKLVVLDVHAQVAADPDYRATMNDVRAWETRNGPIPEGSFVALRTDWSKRWPDHAAMQNQDSQGVAHYPGWSREVLEYLYKTRRITASGHETTDTDPGIATSAGDYSLESYVLGTDHYQIELLTNLDKVPESGGLVFVSFPKPHKGSGFPARVIAIVP